MESRMPELSPRSLCWSTCCGTTPVRYRHGGSLRRVVWSCDSHYQLANRFAWSWKLTSLGIPVVLVYLGFLNASEMTDQGEPFRSADAWKKAVKAHTRGVVPDAVWNGAADVAGTAVYARLRSLELPLDDVYRAQS